LEKIYSMNRNKILELAKKIKALAEKGKDGEKNVAKEKLEKICLKYNISSSELTPSIETKDFYFIIHDSNERDLLINVMTPPSPTEDVGSQEKDTETEDNGEEFEQNDKKNEDVSEDPIDPIKLMKVAVSLDQKPWKKPLDNNLIE